MKTSRKWNFKSIAGMIMLGLVLALMIGSVDVTPAFAKNYHKSYKKYHTDRGYHRGHYMQGRSVYQSYGYYGQREPDYYPPPPVVYAPPPPPGIGIFFPPHFYSPLMGLFHVGCPGWNLS